MPIELSVVIPTYNRCTHLQHCLQSLENQTLPSRDFEVIVIVDGSTDGTLDYLANYTPGYRLKYFFQKNTGLCSARNVGNRQAQGDIILCIDDDTLATPVLLEKHLQAHREQPNTLVAGSLLLHDSVPQSPYTDYERQRRSQFRKRFSQNPKLPLLSHDISGGNLSVSKTLLEKINGFDEDLNRLSNTDGDLAYRLEKINTPIRFNSDALVYLTDIKDFQQSCCEALICGKSYVFLQRKHPETLWKHSPAIQDSTSFLRNIARNRLYFRQKEIWRLNGFIKCVSALIRLSEYLPFKTLRNACYRWVLDFYFWQGVHEQAGKDFAGFVPKKITFLCYHNVSDERIKPFRLYILPEKTFQKQMQWLYKQRYQSIFPDQLYRYLTEGASLPDKPILISFDDGYQALKTTATPLLAALQMKHVHFINSEKAGKTSDWVVRAPDIPLLSDSDIQQLDRQYTQLVDFQAHGQRHLDLSQLNEAETRAEVGGCVRSLQHLLNRPINYLAYAYGEFGPQTAAWVESLGLTAAFTVVQGQIRPGQDPYLLPRVEIFSNDLWIDFICKVHWGWSPIATSRTWLKRRLRKYGGLLKKCLT